MATAGIARTSAFTLGLCLAGCSPGPAGKQDNLEAARRNADGSREANAAAANDVGAAPQPTVAEPIAYTSLKPADCKLLEQNVEEGGYSIHRCSGVAGYALETSESDLRQGLAVIAADGKRSEMDLSARVANGAFNALGPAAEWRGRDPKAPSALIVRLNVAKPEPNKPDTSNLVVIRLGSPTCITAVISPGPRQNEVARDAADGPARDCLKQD